MFNFKKFTCSLLAALAIGNTVLSIPSGTSQMPYNAVNAVAASKEINYHFLANACNYQVTTKTMNIRADHTSKSSKLGEIKAGMIIDTSHVKEEDKWHNPQNKYNMWVRNFEYYGVNTPVQKCTHWVCVTNSSLEFPNYNIKNDKKQKISIYAKPDLHSSKSTVNITPNTKLGLGFVPTYISLQRINNDDWGKVSWFDRDTLKVISGYIFMCDYEDKVIYEIKNMT